MTLTSLIPLIKMNLTLDIFIYGFAQDSQGELYFMGNQTTGDTGKLIKLESTLLKPPEDDDELCFPIIADNGSVTLICL